MEQKVIEALRWIIGILDARKIPYQLSGGFAARLYGSPRELHDIDIDVPEKHFPDILPEISEYITFGPARFQDGKWDCELITLNYHGQDIDLSGAETMRMSDKARTRILDWPADLSAALKMNVENLEVQVIHPRNLARYKKKLDGDHQQIDILAAENYISVHKL